MIVIACTELDQETHGFILTGKLTKKLTGMEKKKLIPELERAL